MNLLKTRKFKTSNFQKKQIQKKQIQKKQRGNVAFFMATFLQLIFIATF